MKRLCQYSDLLGVPKQGVHSIRIFNIAVVDVILTFLLAYIIYKFLNKSTGSVWYMDPRYWVILGLTFFLGIALHWLFCVNTTVNMMLFGPSP